MRKPLATFTVFLLAAAVLDAHQAPTAGLGSLSSEAPQVDFRLER